MKFLPSKGDSWHIDCWCKCSLMKYVFKSLYLFKYIHIANRIRNKRVNINFKWYFICHETSLAPVREGVVYWEIWIVNANPHLWMVPSNPLFLGISIYILARIWTKRINIHFSLYFICHETQDGEGDVSWHFHTACNSSFMNWAFNSYFLILRTYLDERININCCWYFICHKIFR